MLEAILGFSGVNLVLLFTIVFRAGRFVQRVDNIEIKVLQIENTIQKIRCTQCPEEN